MKSSFIAIIATTMMVLPLYAEQTDEILDTVNQIRSSQAYYQVRQIIYRNTALLLAAANNAYTVKKYMSNFRSNPFSATKNIIQHGGSMLSKKGKLDLMVTQLVHTIDALLSEVHVERASTRKALRDLARALARVSEHFKELGRMRKVHRIGKNVTMILDLLQQCKVISHSDEALFILADEFNLEKEIYNLNEQLKQLKRKHGIQDSKV